MLGPYHRELAAAFKRIGASERVCLTFVAHEEITMCTAELWGREFMRACGF